MGPRTPRYGLSLPNRGVLFGATSFDELLAVSEQAALDHLSHGRMILGACVGGSLPREKAEAEFAPFKVKLVEHRPRLEEGITILRRLWTEDRVSHQGRFYQFRDLTLEPKPLQKPCPPIWIATNPKPELTPPPVMDRALRRVGLMADGGWTAECVDEKGRKLPTRLTTVPR